MIKRLLPALSLLLAISAATVASAQFRYTFKDTTTPYVSLGSSATSLNGSTIWDEDDFTASIPFTWKLDSTLTQADVKLSLGLFGIYDNPTNYPDFNGFLIGEMDIADRGTLSGTSSLSPITYTTTGTSPSRIFKLELANAGFYNEYDMYSTMNDSFSMQVWIYETSSIVEYHYGPSKISYASDYFGFNGAGPLVAYLKHVDFDMGTTGKFYHLKGNPASPGLDTAVLPSFPVTALNSWPASGKVYRFSPKIPACVKPATSSFTVGTPSDKTVQFTYTGATSGVDSIVWAWGDGTKQKVTSGFTTPVSKTYAVAGRYTISVTAYNACGSTTSPARQTSVSVGNLSALGDVKVYPNPARDVLMIDGLTGNTAATVMSVVGNVVLRETLVRGKASLSLTALPAGTYSLLLVGADGATGATQFVKQ